VNCRQALARRRVLVERGDLPADFPIPVHLQTEAEKTLRERIAVDELVPSDFVPLSTINIAHRTAIAATETGIL
jgi:hypothetical protein